MSSPDISKLWLDVRAGTGERKVRADFTNDRHYEVVIDQPGHAEQIAYALFQLGHAIATDTNLRETKE
jgi:hypothetical protein